MTIDRDKFLTELARNCLSLRELSEASGLNVVTLTRIKQGNQVPLPATIGRIARALNCSVEQIIKSE